MHKPCQQPLVVQIPIEQRKSLPEKMLPTVFIGVSIVAHVFILLMCSLLSACGVITTLPQDSYDKHLIHFHQEGIEIPTCEWCNSDNADEE